MTIPDLGSSAATRLSSEHSEHILRQRLSPLELEEVYVVQAEVAKLRSLTFLSVPLDKIY